jgi:GDP-mannose 6-dehydrogenase
LRITVVGAGYVGIVSAAWLVRNGHTVTCIERVPSKVDDLNQGSTPIQEPEVAPLLACGHREGRLRATTDPADGLRGADMVWICVGTPSARQGQIDLTSVEAASREIGQHMRQSQDRPLVVLRSTVLPGTTTGTLLPTIEQASGLRVGPDIQLVFHPEFLREGTALEDFDHPPKIVVGEDHARASDRLWQVYQDQSSPRFRLRIAEAEMVKYCDNLFHATKITFANEIGSLCKQMSLDARRVADVFCADTKLNISPRYLRPGFAFGGSCLPKDLRAMLRHAAQLSVELPMLEGIPRSNASQITAFVDRLLQHKAKRVGMVGLAFKSNTDDMRESPHVTVAKRLIGEGIQLCIYDPGIVPQRLVGSNKQAVQAALGHLESLLVASLDDLESCDTIVVNHRIVQAEHVKRWLTDGIRVFDLANIQGVDASSGPYEGIAW